jgi:hypothetical protein
MAALQHLFGQPKKSTDQGHRGGLWATGRAQTPPPQAPQRRREANSQAFDEC